MRLLFDQNISFRIISHLSERFSGSKQVRHVGLQDRPDIEIWDYARSNDYAIVTFDADFYDISLIKGVLPKVIWLRTGNLTTKDIAELIVLKYAEIEKFINDEEQLCLEIE
jgi:predicted nuclease of predicted toxin-antitoxin system